MAAPSFPAEKIPAPGEYNRTNAAGLNGAFGWEKIPPAPGEYNRTNAAGLNGAFGWRESSGGTGSLGHSAISTSPASIELKFIEFIIGRGDIGSDCAQPYTKDNRSIRAAILDQWKDPGYAISETYASVSPIAPRENQVKDLKLIGCGDIGSDCAQPSDEKVAVYTDNILERYARAVLERHLERSARADLERHLRPDDAIRRIRAVADQLSHCKDGDTGIRGPASARCIVLTENQVEDLKLFGGDCAYTQSVGDFPVTAFLERTGYLQPIDSGGVHDVLSINSALKTYQLNHGLEDTGTIDDPTVSMMLSRRCGAPDIVDGVNLTRLHGGDASCFNLFPGGPKWENTNLTYHYYSSVPEAAKPAFKLAFAEWTRVRPEFTFTEVPAAGDIKISFCRGKHGSGDCLPFNGPGRVLAHSFAPCDGRLHVDESQFWSFRNIPNAAYFVDLESAVLHEIGHILGLTHSYDENAIMFPSLKANEIKNRLTRDDIHGINFLYGKY